MTESNHRPQRTDAHSSRDLGDELLFYDRDGDRVHVLNGSARAIYLLCDGTRTVDDVASEMVARYEVDRDVVLTDVRATVDELLGLGLLAGR